MLGKTGFQAGLFLMPYLPPYNSDIDLQVMPSIDFTIESDSYNILIFNFQVCCCLWEEVRDIIAGATKEKGIYIFWKGWRLLILWVWEAGLSCSVSHRLSTVYFIERCQRQAESWEFIHLVLCCVSARYSDAAFRSDLLPLSAPCLFDWRL